jgi:hypothetical protein
MDSVKRREVSDLLKPFGVSGTREIPYEFTQKDGSHVLRIETVPTCISRAAATALFGIFTYPGAIVEMRAITLKYLAKMLYKVVEDVSRANKDSPFQANLRVAYLRILQLLPPVESSQPSERADNTYQTFEACDATSLTRGSTRLAAYCLPPDDTHVAIDNLTAGMKEWLKTNGFSSDDATLAIYRYKMLYSREEYRKLFCKTLIAHPGEISMASLFCSQLADMIFPSGLAPNGMNISDLRNFFVLNIYVCSPILQELSRLDMHNFNVDDRAKILLDLYKKTLSLVAINSKGFPVNETTANIKNLIIASVLKAILLQHAVAIKNELINEINASAGIDINNNTILHKFRYVLMDAWVIPDGNRFASLRPEPTLEEMLLPETRDRVLAMIRGKGGSALLSGALDIAQNVGDPEILRILLDIALTVEGPNELRTIFKVVSAGVRLSIFQSILTVKAKKDGLDMLRGTLNIAQNVGNPEILDILSKIALRAGDLAGLRTILAIASKGARVGILQNILDVMNMENGLDTLSDMLRIAYTVRNRDILRAVLNIASKAGDPDKLNTILAIIASEKITLNTLDGILSVVRRGNDLTFLDGALVIARTVGNQDMLRVLLSIAPRMGNPIILRFLEKIARTESCILDSMSFLADEEDGLFMLRAAIDIVSRVGDLDILRCILTVTTTESGQEALRIALKADNPYVLSAISAIASEEFPLDIFHAVLDMDFGPEVLRDVLRTALTVDDPERRRFLLIIASSGMLNRVLDIASERNGLVVLDGVLKAADDPRIFHDILAIMENGSNSSSEIFRTVRTITQRRGGLSTLHSAAEDQMSDDAQTEVGTQTSPEVTPIYRAFDTIVANAQGRETIVMNALGALGDILEIVPENNEAIQNVFLMIRSVIVTQMKQLEVLPGNVLKLLVKSLSALQESGELTNLLVSMQYL